jgi:hypothetical protein
MYYVILTMYYFDDESDCCGAGANAGAASFSLLEPQPQQSRIIYVKISKFRLYCIPGLWIQIRIRIQILSGFNDFLGLDSLTLWIQICIRFWINLNFWIRIRIRIESIRIHNPAVYCV